MITARVSVPEILKQAGIPFATARDAAHQWSVGLTLGGPEQPNCVLASETQAEAAIAAIEQVDPEGVDAGDYFIDGPGETELDDR